MADLRQGRRFANRYQLTKPLRCGSNAEVWCAIDERDNREVALKFSRDAGHARRLLAAEAERLAVLQHPRIVALLGTELDCEPPFIVLEWVQGRELRDYMGSDYRVWLTMLRPVLDALAYAHAKGVVHGDLSVHNIVTGDDGRAKLIDFADRDDVTVPDDLRGLGAIFYELATGLPASVHRGMPAMAKLPASLQRLTDKLLNDAEHQDLSRVALKVDRILGSDDTTEQFERITPVHRHDSVVAAEIEPVSHRDRHWLPWAAALAGLAAVVALAWFGLQNADESARSTTGSNAVLDAGVRLENQRAEVATLRSAVYEKWLKLESMQVDDWLQLRAQRARDSLSEGERQAGDLDTVAALRSLSEADALLTAMIAEAPGVAADHRAAGWQAYRAGDADAAARHFGIVIAIEPQDETVRDALARSRFLDAVVALSATAREQENDGDLKAAFATLQEAARVDPGSAEIEAEVARLEARIISNDFERQMSAAYSALRTGQFDSARRALKAAAELRSGTPEVRDARLQLESARREADIARLRTAAQTAEKQERWDEVISLYSELLRVDQALVFAQQGRDRARRIASLRARSEALLESGEFSRSDVRGQAQKLVDQIASVQADAPSLQQLSAQLQQVLYAAVQPVAVRLQSDNQTQITIYRVGKIGAFENHELSLLPGRYTVVGTRRGYRDVRADLVVGVGEPPSPLVIQCEEEI